MYQVKSTWAPTRCWMLCSVPGIKPKTGVGLPLHAVPQVHAWQCSSLCSWLAYELSPLLHFFAACFSLSLLHGMFCGNSLLPLMWQAVVVLLHLQIRQHSLFYSLFYSWMLSHRLEVRTESIYAHRTYNSGIFWKLRRVQNCVASKVNYSALIISRLGKKWQSASGCNLRDHWVSLLLHYCGHSSWTLRIWKSYWVGLGLHF